MPIDFRDRVDKLLNIAKKTFGETAVYHSTLDGDIPITGIFDNEYEAVDPDTEKVISANQPVFGVNLLSIDSELVVGDSITIRNLIYNIFDVREDGQGGASLFLHRVDHGQKVYKKKGATSP